MRLEPRLPWDVLFLRCMQNWRDTARREACWRGYEGACDRCADHPYLAVAQGLTWPHWQQHTLLDVITDLSHTLTDAYLDAPYAGSTLREFIWGSRLVPRQRIDPVQAEAIRRADDYVAFVDIWLRHRLAELGSWPTRVSWAATRAQPRD